jgi:recombination protein RecT
MGVPAKVIQGEAQIVDLFKKHLGEIGRVASKLITPDKMLGAFLSSRAKTPQLAECTADSFIDAIKSCAEIGMYPTAALGHIYLIPFRDNKRGCSIVQVMVGYRGFIFLARDIARIEARLVYQADKFEVEEGTSPRIIHRPKVFGNRGDLLGVYAVAIFKDGSTQHEIMSVDEVEANRKRSKASGAGPWVTDYTEMVRKTPVRRLMKYLPLSAENSALSKAIETDNEIEGDFTEATPEPKIVTGQTKTQALKERITKPAAQVQVPAQLENKGVSGAVLPWDMKGGSAKGTPIEQASEEELEKLAVSVRNTLADPAKAQWHDKNQRLLDAVEGELAGRAEPAQSDADEEDWATTGGTVDPQTGEVTT